MDKGSQKILPLLKTGEMKKDFPRHARGTNQVFQADNDNVDGGR